MKKVFAVLLSVTLICLNTCACKSNKKSESDQRSDSSIASSVRSSSSSTDSMVSSSSTENSVSVSENNMSSIISSIESTSPQAIASTVPDGESTVEQPHIAVAVIDPSAFNPTSTSAAEPQSEQIVSSLTPLPSSEYYGLNQLKTMNHSNELIKIYNRLVNGLAEMEETIWLNDSSYRITSDELEKVFLCYYNDYGGAHFWVTGDYTYYLSQFNNAVVAIQVEYSMSRTEKAAAEIKFKKEAKKILSNLNDSMSQYQKEVYIHDAIVSSTSYDSSFQNSFIHYSYGALVNKIAVCDGYAHAFQYLLHAAGINALIAEGTGLNQPHAWNMVKIDGNWYGIDITWDDPVTNDNANNIFYCFFNLPDNTMFETHIVQMNYMSLPSATSSTANYHVVNHSVVSSFSIDDLSSRFAKSDTVRILITCDMEYYINQLQQNYETIIRKAGKMKSLRTHMCYNEMLFVLY